MTYVNFLIHANKANQIIEDQNSENQLFDKYYLADMEEPVK